jgi:hypothetical protein
MTSLRRVLTYVTPTWAKACHKSTFGAQEVSGLIVQAGLGSVDDALAERLHPGPAGTLAFDVTLTAEHQQRLDPLVEVTR